MFKDNVNIFALARAYSKYWGHGHIFKFSGTFFEKRAFCLLAPNKTNVTFRSIDPTYIDLAPTQLVSTL